MPESAIKHITTCIVCGQQFQNWQMDIPIVGQPPSQRVSQFVGALAGHLAKKHGDKMKAIQTGGQEFMGMLIMMLFRTSDPNLQETVEHVRKSVMGLCRSSPISDATILDRVVALGLDQAVQDQVVALMRDLRDYSCETGAYAGQQSVTV